MAHGSPRIEICNSCNMYGMLPRFNKSECPTCKKPTEQISESDLKRKLNLSILDKLFVSFNWNKIKK